MRPTAVVLFALAAGCGKLPSAADPLAADRERFQGTWVVERLDTGSPQETARMFEDAREDRLRFEGETLTVTSPRETERLTFALDAARSPRGLTITNPETATQPARSRRWIYRFDGDTLVLAFRSDGTDAPPDDFEPRRSSAAGEPGVTVVWLRKVGGPADAPPESR